MKPSILWVTDPWSTLDHPKDTTLRLAEECVKLGVPAYWADVKSIRWQQGQVVLDASRIEAVGPKRASGDFTMASARASRPSEFRQIHYRVDPPVDLAYLHPLQLLALGVFGSKRTELVNDPLALFSANEKLEPGLLGPLMAPSLASSSWDALSSFGRAEGRTVLKPLYEAQSHGVELLDWASPEAAVRAKSLVTAATDSFRRPVLLQRYLPAISQGETRLWFLNGRLLAAARKKPRSGEFRIDMDHGGTLAAVTPSPADKKAALKIGKLLRARRIRLAAVDLIDGFVTDFNFTSPGLIVQIEELTRTNLAAPIVKSLLKPYAR